MGERMIRNQVLEQRDWAPPSGVPLWPAFEAAAVKLLGDWDVMRMAVSGGWSDGDPAFERAKLIDDALANFSQRAKSTSGLDPRDVEMFLETTMSDRFNADLEQNTASSVARVLVKVFDEVRNNVTTGVRHVLGDVAFDHAQSTQAGFLMEFVPQADPNAEAQQQQQQQQQQHHQYGGTSTALTLDGDIPEAHVVEAVPIQDQHQQYQQQAHQQQYQQQYQGYAGAYAQPSYGGSGAGVGMDSSGPTKYGSNAQPLMGGGPTVMPLPGGQTPDTSEFGFLFGRRRLVIKQKFDMMEAAAQAVGCGCIEQANEYYVFDFDTGEEILLVKEESEMFQRGCCHPHHSATLHYFDVRQGVPPSTVAMRTEKPFKLGCCACFDICRHEAKAKLPDGTKFSHVTTPFMGGGLAPKMEVMSRNGTVDATITGPTCCLGGLVELCQDIEFDYHKGKQEQIIGRIVKKKPDNTQGRLHEVAGDADMFVLELPPDATPEQAASMLSSALLLDYLYFEGGGPFQYNPADGSCQINICNCYCLGCVCPCQCQCGGNNSD